MGWTYPQGMRRPRRWRFGQSGWAILLLVAIALLLRVQAGTQTDPADEALGFTSQPGAYYPSCRAAHQAGRTNIRRGESGYRPQLDADGDGLACEPLVISGRG